METALIDGDLPFASTAAGIRLGRTGRRCLSLRAVSQSPADYRHIAVDFDARQHRCGITVIQMRFRFDERKSERLRTNPKRGIGFEELKSFFHPYYLDQRSIGSNSIAQSDGLETSCTRSFLKCGKTRKKNITISSLSGEPRNRNGNFMKNSHKRQKPAVAEEIARLRTRGRMCPISSQIAGG